ncbi:MAG: ester cyclase, partial [Gemmatimonadota bacterium]
MNHNNILENSALKKTVDRWMNEVWQKRNVDAVDELHTSDFVDRSPAGRSPDNKGFKEGLVRFYEAFPDFFATTDDLVIDASEEKVAVRWSAVGTHEGQYMGVPPTGRRIA